MLAVNYDASKYALNRPLHRPKIINQKPKHAGGLDGRHGKLHQRSVSVNTAQANCLEAAAKVMTSGALGCDYTKTPGWGVWKQWHVKQSLVMGE